MVSRFKPPQGSLSTPNPGQMTQVGNRVRGGGYAEARPDLEVEGQLDRLEDIPALGFNILAFGLIF